MTLSLISRYGMKMTTSFLENFLAVAMEAARTAGAYSKSKWGTNLSVEYKGEINLVTEVDKNSEKIIVDILQKNFPDHDILGEEGQGERRDSPYRWIIDPLDGTTNFAHGYPLYAVSIALEHDDVIVVGVVYDPLRDEMFAAIRGQGAFCNDKKVQVSKTDTLIRAMVGTGFSYIFKENPAESLDQFRDVILKVQGIRRDGVAAIDLCYVACGRYDGFWELNLFPWDMAAGLVILEEAGGCVTRFDGTKFSVYDKEVLATNGRIHTEFSGVLTPPPSASPLA